MVDAATHDLSTAPVESGPAFKDAEQDKARELVERMRGFSTVSDFAQR